MASLTLALFLIMGYMTNGEIQRMGHFKKIEKMVISNEESHIVIDLNVNSLLDATAVTRQQLEAFKTKVKAINNLTNSQTILMKNLDRQWSGIQDQLYIYIQYFTLFEEVLQEDSSEDTTKPDIIQKFENKVDNILGMFNHEEIFQTIQLENPKLEEKQEDEIEGSGSEPPDDIGRKRRSPTTTTTTTTTTISTTTKTTKTIAETTTTTTTKSTTTTTITTTMRTITATTKKSTTPKTTTISTKTPTTRTTKRTTTEQTETIRTTTTAAETTRSTTTRTTEVEVETTEPVQHHANTLTETEIEKIWQQTIDAQHVFEEDVLERRQQDRLNWERKRKDRLAETIKLTTAEVVASTPYKPPRIPNSTDTDDPGRTQTGNVPNIIVNNPENPIHHQIKLESNDIVVSTDEPLNPSSNQILITPETLAQNKPNKILRRKKRQFGEIAGSVALIASITAAVNNYLTKDQMEKLSTGLQSVQDREMNMVHYLNGSKNEIAVSRNALIKLQQTTIELNNNMEAEIKKEDVELSYLFMKQSIRDLQTLYDEYHNVLQHAVQGQLAITTVSVRALHDALHDLKRIGNKRELKLTLPDVSQIFHAKVSLLRTKSGSRIFLTLPMYTEDSEFDLYTFRSVPFHATNQTLIRINPEKNVLAIRTGNNIPDLKFKDLLEEDLHKCLKLDTSYICKQSVIYKGNHKSCLKELFTSASYERIINLCNRYIIPAEEEIIPLSNNEFLMIFPEETAYDLKCANHTAQKKIKGISKITVEKTCELIFNDFLVRPIKSNKIEEKLIWKYWNDDGNLFLSNLTDIRLDAILMKAKELHRIPKIDPILSDVLDKIGHRPWFEFNKHPQLNFSTMIILFIIMAISITIIVILYKKLKTAKRYRKENSREKEYIKLEQRYPILKT